MYFTYSDAGAKKLHYAICAQADTVYYMEDLSITTLKKARYSEVTETRKCADYKVITVRDKKGSGAIININHNLTKANEPNVIALYKLYPDGHKLFHVTPQPPAFPGGEDAQWTFLNKNNKHREDAIKELKISNSLVEVTYTIDKNGNVTDIKLVNITSDVDKFDKAQMDRLREYVTLIFSEMPRHSPAVFRGERVDYFTGESLTFK
ncbi:hypothetical protein D3C87_1495170 [compost metagenome]